MQVHILGGPGSGKTTLAQTISSRFKIPHYDLDTVSGKYGDLMEPYIREAIALAQRPAWVTEGIYLHWIDPLLYQADAIVLLEISWPVAAWRIIRRHIIKSLLRTNPYPTKLMYGFLRFTHSYYAGKVWSDSDQARTVREFLVEQKDCSEPIQPEVLLRQFIKYRNTIPASAEFTRLYLDKYREKLFIVRGNPDREQLLKHLAQIWDSKHYE